MDKEYKEKIIEIRNEVKSFHGVEYKLILVGVDNGENKETFPSDKNDLQWWNVEYTDKSKKLAKYAFKGCLYFDTRFMTGYRLMDKYHQSELEAMRMINYIMSDYFKARIKWLGKEISFFLYVMYKTGLRQLWFNVKKLFQKNEKKAFEEIRKDRDSKPTSEQKTE